MFNLNEGNRIVMAQHPSDMRIGVYKAPFIEKIPMQISA